jgi:hypothetical protein
MANLLLIEKQSGGYFKFTLNGDTDNAITSIQNDLLAVGNQLHFKTGNGANIIKEQLIYPEDLTIISGGTFTFTTVAQVWAKLIDIDYFAWLGSGSFSGIDRFSELIDTFQYTGQAGKAVIVDNSELKLTTIELNNFSKFTELSDTPDALVPNKMVVVNNAGDALILQDQPTPPEQFLNSVGYFDYNDLVTQTTPLNAVSNVALKLTNDTNGANTNTSQNPYGVSYVWDSIANRFNFSELSVGDTIDVRIHVQITTTTSNQKVVLNAKFGIGSVAEFTNSIYENVFKSAGVHEISFVAPFYMGSNYITDYPAELYLITDASATVKVNGWYVRILRKNINIITVDYTVPDATSSVKGVVRLGGDLAGTANTPTVPGLATKVPNTRTISTTAPLSGGGDLSGDLSLFITQANSVDSGYLTSGDWSHFNDAYNHKIVSAGIAGTTTKTLTLTQQDGGTLTASWTDENSDAVTSVFGRTGAVVAVSGDYTTGQVTEVTNKKYQTDLQALYNDATSSIQTQLNAKALDSSVVHLTGNETITGTKSFNSTTGIGIRSNNSGSGYGIYSDNSSTGIAYYVANSGQGKGFLVANALSSLGNLFEGSYNGTQNFVVNYLGELTASKLIKSGGTSSQFLKADGSVDSSTYALSSQLHNAVTIGTANGLSLSTQVLSLGLASSTLNGALSFTDWVTFNNKVESVAANAPLGSTGGKSPVISITQATTSSNGYLSSTDWNTFNNKIGGTGTTNYLPKFTGASTLGNSLIYDNGTNVGIGTTSPSEKLDVNGNIKLSASDSRIKLGDSVGRGILSNSDTSAYISINGSSNATTNNIGVITNSEISFNTGASYAERMRITSGGQVQISSPISDALKLTNTNSGAYNGIIVQNDASNQVVLGMGGSTVGGTNQNRGYSGTVSNIDYYLMTNNTARLLITSGGNVGIGTTSPSGKLSIVDTYYNTFFADSTSQYGSGLILSGDGGSDQRSWRQFVKNASGGVALTFEVSTSGVSYGSSPTGLTYSEKMRITPSGNILIGTSSSIGSGIFQVKTSSANNVAHFQNGTSDAGYGLVFLNVAGSAVGSIGWTNVMTSYNVTSDYRLKEDFKDYSGLDLISKIKTYDYKWKVSEDRMYGVKAHELQEVVPYAVTGKKDAELMQSVDYSKLVPILVQAIQELQEKINILENK